MSEGPKLKFGCLKCGAMWDFGKPKPCDCVPDPLPATLDATDDVGTDYTHEITFRLRQNINPEDN